jgi:nitrate/nitrite-specific signal transduction histidine kinase
LYDRDAHLTGRLVVLRDITRSKRLETALQELNADLERQVSQRTAELQATIRELKTEIAERQRVEAALRRAEESLAQRLADQSRKLTALYEVILMGGRTLHMQEMLKEALAKIMAVLGGEAGCVHLQDEAHPDGAGSGRRSGPTTLRLAAHQGLSDAARTQIITLPVDWPPQAGIPYAVNDLATDAGLPVRLRLPGLRAYLGAPILLHGQTIGALSLFWTQPCTFSVEDIALFGAMADQLGILVENVRLRQRIEETALVARRGRHGPVPARHGRVGGHGCHPDGGSRDARSGAHQLNG